MQDKEYNWVYILTCNDGSMYTGMTGNIVERYADHITKKAKCKYTRRKDKHPLKLSACWQIFGTRGDAIKVEIYIQKKDKKFKEALLKKPGKLEELFIKDRKYELRIEPFNNIVEIEDKVKTII